MSDCLIKNEVKVKLLKIHRKEIWNLFILAIKKLTFRLPRKPVLKNSKKKKKKRKKKKTLYFN